MSNRVLCEVDPATKKIIRILRRGGAGLFLKPEQALELPKIEAMERIRKRVYEIAKGDCNGCGKALSYPSGFHMHEVKPRGKGGEISTYNSIALCADCHIGKSGAHANRYPQWTKC